MSPAEAAIVRDNLQQVLIFNIFVGVRDILDESQAAMQLPNVLFDLNDEPTHILS